MKKLIKKIVALFIVLFTFINSLSTIPVNAASKLRYADFEQLSYGEKSFKIKWDKVDGIKKYRVEVYANEKRDKKRKFIYGKTVKSNTFTYKGKHSYYSYSVKIYTIDTKTGKKSSYYKLEQVFTTPQRYDADNIDVYWKPGTIVPSINLTYQGRKEVEYLTLQGKHIKTVINSYDSTCKKAIKEIKNYGFKVRVRYYDFYYKNGKRTKVYGKWSKTKTVLAQPYATQTYETQEDYSNIDIINFVPIKNASSYDLYRIRMDYNLTYDKYTYVLEKYKTLDRNETTIRIPYEEGYYGNYILIPRIKEKGKTYKFDFSSRPYIYSTYDSISIYDYKFSK